MQQTKPSILCTGPVDLSLLSDRDKKKAEIDIINFTTITSSLPESTQQDIKNIIDKRTFVVFTSNNAVKAVMNYLDNKHPDWIIFCLGNTTYELARKYFGAGSIRQTASNAGMLAERIIDEKKIKEIVFFCGSLRKDDLPDTLRRNNVTVKEIIVYETALAPAAITKDYDAVLFFSPSAVESFFSVNTLPPKTVLYAIGNTTAEKIKSCSKNPVIVADEPDKIDLIRKTIKSLALPLA